MKRDTTKARQMASLKYHAYRTFFNSDEGKLILTDLMKACHFTDTTIADKPEVTYFNEGKRAVVLQMMRTAKLTQKDISNLINRMFSEETGEDNYF